MSIRPRCDICDGAERLVRIKAKEEHFDRGGYWTSQVNICVTCFGKFKTWVNERLVNCPKCGAPKCSGSKEEVDG